MLHKQFRYTNPLDLTSSDAAGLAYGRMLEAFKLDPATAMLTEDMHHHMAALFVDTIEARKAITPDFVRTAVHRSFRSSPLNVFGSHFLDHLTDVVMFALFLKAEGDLAVTGTTTN